MVLKFCHGRAGLILASAAIIALAVLPFTGVPRSWFMYLFNFFVYLAMVNMWNLLAGYSGLISLCPPAFLGLSGYALAIGTWIGIPWWAGIMCGVITAAVFALLISGAVLRLSGIYFAIGTLVVPEALRMIFYLWRPVGGAMHGAGAGYMVKGINGVSMSTVYWLALFVGTGSVILMRIILKSRLGLGLSLIRDNEKSAASCGVNVFGLKMCAFMISAAVTGMAGAIYYLKQGYIEPSVTFNVRWTMSLLLATVIGGIRTEEGPVIGTMVIVFLYFLLARYSGYNLLIQGLILIFIMLLYPRGIAGILRRSRYYRQIMGMQQV